MSLQGHRLVVVLPAYNAARTLARTYEEIPHELVDEILLVDDASCDATVAVAQQLGLRLYRHDTNKGYGANQKTCYREALKLNADIVVMLHPDYQYSPKLIAAMAAMITSGHYDVVLGSRILGGKAIEGGMPRYKYFSNRVLTFLENLATGAKLSEYHTGYRAFSRRVLEALPIWSNSDGFVFDNQMLLQALHFGFRVGEISCPTHYFPEASSVDFRGSVKYGMGVLQMAATFRLQRWGLLASSVFTPPGERE